MDNLTTKDSNHIGDVNGSIHLSELEDFFDQMCEDWHLWDEGENGQYPVQRTLDAMKKFIDTKKQKRYEKFR